MSRVRRTRYVAFAIADGHSVDVYRLMQGQVELRLVRRFHALSVLTGAEQELSEDEFALTLRVPEEWTSQDEVLAEEPSAQAESLAELARKGVVVSDAPDPHLEELRRRDELLSAEQWSSQAAVYHFTTKWRDVRVGLGPEPRSGTSVDELLEQVAAEFERYGEAPPHFAAMQDPVAVARLPPVEREGPLYEALLRRRTSRAFDPDTRMTREQLATVLLYVWGCHGMLEVGDNIAIVKKTSPSGGGLHPVEVYPLVRDVEGVEPGLYHYRIQDHALELISPLTAADAEELALEFTAGQTYFRSAHALFLMTARFYRSFWKYRSHARAYGVLLMDAGHLSQTLYLVCTELGLGAFITAAINSTNIENRLGLDGFREGAIAVCGCGPPAAAAPGLEPSFEHYP